MASYRDYLPVVASGDWVRPSDWLPMPVVTSAEQKFVGLHGVWEDGDNVVAFLFSGAYTVDWGDGVVENVADNVKAEHQYSWASIPANTTTSQGYRQVMITVTPQAGQNLTSCNFQQRYTGRNQAYSTGFLDVTLSMPNASSGASITFGGTTVRHANVERATVLTIGACTSLGAMFRNCLLLRDVPLFNTASVTVMAQMFMDCQAIRTVPLFDTVNVLSTNRMFFQCSSLESVPLFDTSKVTDMAFMFTSCYSLETIPQFDTSLVITMEEMLNNCITLKYIPLLNTANVVNMFSLFRHCYSLKSIPLLNTVNVTNMAVMFNSCFSLQSIPALSTAGITTTAGTDYGVNFAVNTSTLARCEMVFARTVGFGNAGLGAPALVEIFTNLVDRSATTSATITITGNWGASLLTAGERAIATGKNWTITG